MIDSGYLTVGLTFIDRGMTMDLLDNQELKNLIDSTGGIQISIYIPTEYKSTGIQQNPVRFKNQISQVEKALAARGMAAREISKLLEPATDLAEDNFFWREQSDGLAAFLNEQAFLTYRLPIAFDELVIVSNRLHLKPLLNLFGSEAMFFILALSQNQVQLFKATRYTIHEVELQDMPTSLADALQYIDSERYVQRRSAGGQGTGSMHSGVEEQKDVRMREFFRVIDKGLQAGEGIGSAPVVLAGVDYLHPIYHEVSVLPNLVKKGITGSPANMSMHELHHQAWEFVAPLFAQDRQADLALFQQLHGQQDERASSELDQIIPAAVYGRVGKLFVPADLQVWGAFDEESGEVEFYEGQTPDSQDLLDLAAVHTLINGGSVYLCEASSLPGQVTAAAVLRY